MPKHGANIVGGRATLSLKLVGLGTQPIPKLWRTLGYLTNLRPLCLRCTLQAVRQTLVGLCSYELPTLRVFALGLTAARQPIDAAGAIRPSSGMSSGAATLFSWSASSLTTCLMRSERARLERAPLEHDAPARAIAALLKEVVDQRSSPIVVGVSCQSRTFWMICGSVAAACAVALPRLVRARSRKWRPAHRQPSGYGTSNDVNICSRMADALPPPPPP